MSKIYLLEPSAVEGGPAEALPEEKVQRWNQGDAEALVLVAGKMRLAILLDYDERHNSWWALPLFGLYEANGSIRYDEEPVVRVVESPRFGINVSYVDLRKGLDIPHRFLDQADRPGWPLAQLEPDSLEYLNKRFAQHFLRLNQQAH